MDSSVLPDKQYVVFVRGEITEFQDEIFLKFDVIKPEEIVVIPFDFSLRLEPDVSEIPFGDVATTKVELISDSEISGQVELSCQSEIQCRFPYGNIISNEKDDAVLEVFSTQNTKSENSVLVIGRSLDDSSVEEIELFRVTVNPKTESIPQISLELDSEEEILEKGDSARTIVRLTSESQTDVSFMLQCDPSDICETKPNQIKANGAPAILKVTPINFDKSDVDVLVSVIFQNEVVDARLFTTILQTETNGGGEVITDENSKDTENGKIFDRVEQLVVIIGAVIAAVGGAIGIIYKVKNKPISQK